MYTVMCDYVCFCSFFKHTFIVDSKHYYYLVAQKSILNVRARRRCVILILTVVR